jgi:hypothetical protein
MFQIERFNQLVPGKMCTSPDLRAEERGKETVAENAIDNGFSIIQWEFQDPKMEVLYYIRQYFVGIFPYIGLT